MRPYRLLTSVAFIWTLSARVDPTIPLRAVPPVMPDSPLDILMKAQQIRNARAQEALMRQQYDMNSNATIPQQSRASQLLVLDRAHYSLQEFMPAEVYRATGLEKLSNKERWGLTQWLAE